MRQNNTESLIRAVACPRCPTSLVAGLQEVLYAQGNGEMHRLRRIEARQRSHRHERRITLLMVLYAQTKRRETWPVGGKSKFHCVRRTATRCLRAGRWLRGKRRRLGSFRWPLMCNSAGLRSE